MRSPSSCERIRSAELFVLKSFLSSIFSFVLLSSLFDLVYFRRNIHFLILGISFASIFSLSPQNQLVFDNRLPVRSVPANCWIMGRSGGLGEGEVLFTFSKKKFIFVFENVAVDVFDSTPSAIIPPIDIQKKLKFIRIGERYRPLWFILFTRTDDGNIYLRSVDSPKLLVCLKIGTKKKATIILSPKSQNDSETFLVKSLTAYRIFIDGAKISIPWKYWCTYWTRTLKILETRRVSN